MDPKIASLESHIDYLLDRVAKLEERADRWDAMAERRELHTRLLAARDIPLHTIDCKGMAEKYQRGIRTVRRWTKEPGFPKPLQTQATGHKAAAWNSDQVETWFNNRLQTNAQARAQYEQQQKGIGQYQHRGPVGEKKERGSNE